MTPTKAARRIKEAKTLVVGAWMTGWTNAYAGNVNKGVKDAKHHLYGSIMREVMRRRLLLEKIGMPPLNRCE